MNRVYTIKGFHYQVSTQLKYQSSENHFEDVCCLSIDDPVTLQYLVKLALRYEAKRILQNENRFYSQILQNVVFIML